MKALKEYLNKQANTYKHIANTVLETWGYGLEWEYYTKRIPIYNGWKEKYDREVTISFRRNKYSGNLYYYSFNQHEWKYCKTDNMRLSMGPNK